MDKKKTTNPAVITFDDFMFYVIYTREHGYGVSNHRDFVVDARQLDLFETDKSE